MPATVINVKDAPKGWQDNPAYVYIGRSTKEFSNLGWGNPYYLKIESDRAYILKQYIDFIQKRLLNKDLNIMVLADKILVCFCAPKFCHGDILALIVNTIQYSNPPMNAKVPPNIFDERFASSEL